MTTPENSYLPTLNLQKSSRRDFLKKLGKIAVTAAGSALLLKKGSVIHADSQEQNVNFITNPFLIDTDGNQKMSTLTDGTFVIWSEISSMKQQILFKNLETNTVPIEITTDTCVEPEAISNGKLIYAQGNENQPSEIHIFDLLRGIDTLISSAEQGVCKNYPCLNENTAFWIENQNGQSCLKGYSLDSNLQFDISTETNPKTYTAVDGNTLVWTELINQQWNLMTYDLNTKQTKQWTTYNETLGKPNIYNDIITYTKNPLMSDQIEINPSELHILNIRTGQDNVLTNSSQISTATINYKNPAIANGWLIYAMEQTMTNYNGLLISLPSHIMLVNLANNNTFMLSQGNGEDFPSIYQNGANPNKITITWVASTNSTFETTIMGAKPDFLPYNINLPYVRR